MFVRLISRWIVSAPRLRFLQIGVLLGVLVGGCFSASAQSIAGKWIFQKGTLDNGEKDIIVLDLTQTSDQLTGTFRSLGWSQDIRGTVAGTDFQIFDRAEQKNPTIVGKLVGGELQGTLWGNTAFVAKPATRGDIPVVPYIEPPVLQDVLYNHLARTPPMGWNSWNLFAGKIDDQTVRTMADAIVSSGMRDSGYTYINIDDTWEGVRDAEGTLHANHKFPDMKALADYVHSKGLKLGIYSSPGPRTCAGYPASYGHEQQDAKTFAFWGIDYLKYDWCSAGQIYKDSDLQAVYQTMGAALEATGKPMVYSLCEYGMGNVQQWGDKVGANLWRTTGDISDKWSSMIDNVERQIPTAPNAGPGHWNDPDMLEIGNGHMTTEEYRTHMTLWAVSAAPLLAGNDVRNMSVETASILMNKEVIAVDQDSLGKQATPVKLGEVEMWIKPLADGGVAVAMVNLGKSEVHATLHEKDLELRGPVRRIRNLWSHKDVVFTKGELSEDIPSHGALLLRVSSTLR